MATPPASAPQFALMGQALKVIKDEQKSGFIEVAGAHAKLNDKLANIHSKVAALKTDSSTVKSDVADIKSDLATLTTNVAALADLVNTIIKAIDPNNNPATFHKSKSKDITAELQAATVRVDRTTYKDGALAEEVVRTHEFFTPYCPALSLFWHTQVLALKARDPPFFPFVGNALLEATAATKKYANGEAANLKRRMAERLGAFLTEFDAKNVVTTIGDTIPDRDAERLQLAKVARAILTVFKADVPDGAGRSADECAIACMTPEMTSRFVLLFLHHCGFKADKDAKSLCRYLHPVTTFCWVTFDDVINVPKEANNSDKLLENARIWLYVRYGLYYHAADIAGVTLEPRNVREFATLARQQIFTLPSANDSYKLLRDFTPATGNNDDDDATTAAAAATTADDAAADMDLGASDDLGLDAIGLDQRTASSLPVASGARVQADDPFLALMSGQGPFFLADNHHASAVLMAPGSSSMHAAAAAQSLPPPVQVLQEVPAPQSPMSQLPSSQMPSSTPRVRAGRPIARQVSAPTTPAPTTVARTSTAAATLEADSASAVTTPAPVPRARTPASRSTARTAAITEPTSEEADEGAESAAADLAARAPAVQSSTRAAASAASKAVTVSPTPTPPPRTGGRKRAAVTPAVAGDSRDSENDENDEEAADMNVEPQSKCNRTDSGRGGHGGRGGRRVGGRKKRK